MAKHQSNEQKKRPKWSGFFIAAWFWVFSIAMFYSPTYFKTTSAGIYYFFSVLGWLALTISIVGAFVEVSRIIKNEGFSYWGVSLVFLVPSLGLHLFQFKYLTNNLWIIITKATVLILFLFGSGLFLYGISFFIEKKEHSQISDNQSTGFPPLKFKNSVELVSTILIALITVLTFIFQIINQFIMPIGW